MKRLLSIRVAGCFQAKDSELECCSAVDIDRWVGDSDFVGFEDDARTRDWNGVDRAVEVSIEIGAAGRVVHGEVHFDCGRGIQIRRTERDAEREFLEIAFEQVVSGH